MRVAPEGGSPPHPGVGRPPPLRPQPYAPPPPALHPHPPLPGRRPRPRAGFGAPDPSIALDLAPAPVRAGGGGVGLPLRRPTPGDVYPARSHRLVTARGQPGPGGEPPGRPRPVPRRAARGCPLQPDITPPRGSRTRGASE